MLLKKSMLLTIIAESILEPTLKELVEGAGATGYTIERVSTGWGKHGSRPGQFENDQTIKMLLVASPAITKAVIQEIAVTLQPNYSIMAFQHEVEVMNGASAVSG